MALVVWYNLTTASSQALSWDMAVTRLVNQALVLGALIVILGTAHFVFSLRHWNNPQEVGLSYVCAQTADRQLVGYVTRAN